MMMPGTIKRPVKSALYTRHKKSLLRKLRVMAAERDTTLSNIVGEALSQFVEREEAQERKGRQ